MSMQGLPPEIALVSSGSAAVRRAAAWSSSTSPAEAPSNGPPARACAAKRLARACLCRLSRAWRSHTAPQSCPASVWPALSPPRRPSGSSADSAARLAARRTESCRRATGSASPSSAQAPVTCSARHWIKEPKSSSESSSCFAMAWSSRLELLPPPTTKNISRSEDCFCCFFSASWTQAPTFLATAAWRSGSKPSDSQNDASAINLTACATCPESMATIWSMTYAPTSTVVRLIGPPSSRASCASTSAVKGRGREPLVSA
mmetsp:Transcript_26386/g.87479  ORF Transcript_26386/g.87479 Transcript_26386/m.87479 type:complete len:260 (+) Transcript_26386:1166-1945(+)